MTDTDRRATRDGTVDPLAHFRTALQEQSMTVRAAQQKGRRAGHSKAVLWNNTGEFLLLPHDDLAQLSDPRQDDFEIRHVRRVVAANFYAAMPDTGGALKIWNVEPDAPSRAKTGVTHSGYPYPPDRLAGHDALIVRVSAGDLVLLNGNLIHAVLGGIGSKPRRRLLITCFMGTLPDGDLVWWI